MDVRLQARERLRQLPDHQRTAWLDIAEAEFRAFGFEGASLNRILAKAGISKGQAYYYFADKGELYRAVVERALATLAGLVDARPFAPASVAAYWDDVAALFGRITMVLNQHDRLADLGRGIYREAAAQAAIADLVGGLESGFAQMIVAGQAVGAIRNDLPLDLLTSMAFAAARAADHWFARQAGELGPDAALALNHQVLGLFVAMLAPAKATSARSTSLLD